MGLGGMERNWYGDGWGGSQSVRPIGAGGMDVKGAGMGLKSRPLADLY